MNKKQIAYQLGRVINQNYDLMFILSSGYLTYTAIDLFIKSKNNLDMAVSVIGGACSLFYDIKACSLFVPRLVRHYDVKTVNKTREHYPLEHIDSVIIDDAQGLEKLLNKTYMREKKEWGTFFKTHDDRNRAVIYTILSPDDAKTSGLITKGKRYELRVNGDVAESQGYNGGHHYHPSKGSWVNARNYTINLNDRIVTPPNWLNLLTFNMPSGPEIIGFNRQHVYIPKHIGNKAELIRAAPKQIMEYLKN